MDGVSLADVLKVAKDLVIAILDTLKALVTLFGKLVAECLNLLDDMLNAPIGFPPLAAIFKNATGEDLRFGFPFVRIGSFSDRQDDSVINAVCYSVAIPFTILYKLVKGSSPFPKAQIGEQAAVRPPSVDELMCYRGVLTFIFAPIDMGLDIAGYGRVPVPRYIKYMPSFWICRITYGVWCLVYWALQFLPSIYASPTFSLVTHRTCRW
jgi:hypothetical protein